MSGEIADQLSVVQSPSPNQPALGPPTPVVYVIASMITGGTQTHLLQVFSRLNRSRFRPVLFVLRDGGDLLDAVREAGVEVRTFSMGGSLKSPSDLRGLWGMCKALREIRPGVVHGYLLRGNFYAALAGRLARVPVVVTSKRGLHAPVGAAERFAVRVSGRLSDTVTGNAPQVLEFTREVEGPIPTPMVMIPSGIDTERFDPATVAPAAGERLRCELGIGEAPVVGTAITFRPRKGFRMLFEAMAELRRQLPDAQTLIAGAEEMPPEPAALAEELGLTGCIHLLGRRSDMPEVLSAFDCFVLPSQSEGMSNAILEAMAMQLPVVVTAVGGAPEVVEHSRNGYLVDYPDASAMAGHLATLLCDSGLRRRIGQAARQTAVTNYSAATMVRQMEDLYAKLLSGKTRGVSSAR